MIRPTAVERAYRGLREMILDYRIKPGDRINEVVLSRHLGLSRTPLREALNRLAVERLLSAEASSGFERPPLNIKEICDLYELRVILETVGVRLAVERASDEEIDSVIEFWSKATRDLSRTSRQQRIVDDETFHERVVGLSGNLELVGTLRSVNARIHFVRWAGERSSSGDHKQSYAEHRKLLTALKSRSRTQSARLLHQIIERRREEIVETVQRGAAALYVT